VKEADRERYLEEVALLGRKLSEGTSLPEATDDNAVWEVYSGIEKLIAVLKFRLEYETPGVLTKLPDAKDPARLLRGASDLLLRSEREISERRLVEAVETLRGARNGLRSYLTAKRKAATRAEKPTRVPGTKS
jgi:hypothetical protein